MTARLRQARAATVLAAAALVTLTAFNTGLAQAASWARKSATAIRTVNGLGFLSAGIWVTFGLGAGLAAIGVAWLIVEWLAD